MQGKHDTWVLDDGRSDEVRDLAAELGARYVRRLSSNGAKAGNINHALSIAKGDFFVIFDADFVPLPQFLHETVPFFATDDVAFVQTPQVYGNLDTVISKGAGYMQSVFYKFIQPGRNRFNAAFSVGTNVIYRRSAVGLDRRHLLRLQVGGRLDVADAAREGLADGLHPDRARRRGHPRDRRGLHQAAAALGDGRLRDHAHPQPAVAEAQPHDGPAAAVPGDLDALPDRHRAAAADPGAAAADLLQPHAR